MRNAGAVALVLFAAFSTPYLTESLQADDHWYEDCLSAAAYQLDECLGNVLEHDVDYTSTDCWRTFRYLRDHEFGCHQFPHGLPSEV